MPAVFAADISNFSPLFPWIGFLIAGIALWLSLRACRRRRLIDNLPTSKTQGVFIGLVEIKGMVECEQPLESYLAQVPCVYYSYDIEESWSRQVTETESDGKGGTRTVTRTESGWTSVASETQSTPFYLKDDTGHLLIQPEGARIEAIGVYSETCTPMNALYYGKGPAGGIMNSDHMRRFTETAIPLQAPLFVVGQARERKDIVAPEIAADPQASEFLISTRTEAQISSGLGWQLILFFLLGAVLAPGGHIVHDLVGEDDITATSILLYIVEFIFFMFAWGVGWFITVYNSLVELRQRVEQGWSQVDVQIKRRHDLIPNLLNAVKGYRDHEAETQTALAAMRSQMNATAPGEKGDDFHAVQSQVQILKEAYPELKADENFLALQKSLSETEQRIALARAYFNDIATFYNTRLGVIPDRFIASVGAMKPRALMEANDFERAPVDVKFADAPAALPPLPTSNQ